jgi:hypothetical protein
MKKRGGPKKHKWELFFTNSSHSTTGNRGYRSCQTTVIVAGCSERSEILRMQPRILRQYLLKHCFGTVLSVFPGENLPGQRTYYRTSARESNLLSLIWYIKCTIQLNGLYIFPFTYINRIYTGVINNCSFPGW